jgi:hypothetical protein
VLCDSPPRPLEGRGGLFRVRGGVGGSLRSAGSVAVLRRAAARGQGASNGTHRVDNVGQHNDVVFRFSAPVTVTRAFLDSVVNDSDISYWVGNSANPITMLDDTILDGFTYGEDSADDDLSRWATLSGQAGNVLVIAAWTEDETPEDRFKVRKLDISCEPLPPPPTKPPCPTCPSTTAKRGSKYSSSVKVTEGTGPFTFSVKSGALPPGLTLNASTGAITGTPTTSGKYYFTIKVVDANGKVGTVDCKITVYDSYCSWTYSHKDDDHDGDCDYHNKPFDPSGYCPWDSNHRDGNHDGKCDYHGKPFHPSTFCWWSWLGWWGHKDGNRDGRCDHDSKPVVWR